MNTTRLKSFAPEARRKLMEQVGRKLDHVFTAQTPDLSAQRPLVASLRKAVEAEGKAPLIERVAYIWFNRFAALRYLDAKGWHPFHARVLTPVTADETQPELLRQVRGATVPNELRDWCDPKRIDDLLAGRIPSANPQAEVQRLLVVGVCQFYAFLLPDVFERVDDFHRLLLPDDLLTEHSVLHAFQTEITDADCAEVEILGWLYQFYIAEKKDAVMSRKSAVATADIPAVTQLFTPHWIVRYLVENSLGRLWLLNRPGSRIREHMPYYIDGEAQTDFLKITKPEEIHLVDPAVGSGHMLTYAFDLLYLIYEEEGYPPTDISEKILRHNLHGLEICPRAAQLAELALVFKAREKSRRFFQAERLVRPRILALRNVHFAEGELRDYIAALGLGELFNQPMLRFLHEFEEATTFGSLIQPCLDEQNIAFARRAIEAKDLGGQLFLGETHAKVLRVLEQAEALTPRYHVAVANPPYMGSGAMNASLKKLVEELYPAGKPDLYGCFILRLLNFVVPKGAIGLITIPNWMFLSGFEDLRKQLLNKACITSLIQNGRGIWGADFGSCSFCITNQQEPTYRGFFRRLFHKASQVSSPDELSTRFFDASEFPVFRASADEFRAIPGAPIAYWISSKIRHAFATHRSLGDIAEPRVGLQTGSNERFVRNWVEVAADDICFDANDTSEARMSGKRWFPYNKGGPFRKWFGNAELVVLWEKDGAVIKNFKNSQGKLRSRPQNTGYFFRPSVSWSKVSIGAVAFRFFPAGFVFDVAGCSIFPAGKGDAASLLGFLNSKVAASVLAFLSPTMNYEVGHIAQLPVLETASDSSTATVTESISLAKADWDNFETSWDFRDQPLLRPGLKGATLEASWRNWETQCTASIRRMQELETENNRLFIAAYDLDGELQPEVPENQITLARADVRRDMAAFLSYAVGCMMGRYSLDHPGLILANADDSLREFLEKVGRPQDQLAFTPDEDGIVPVLDDEYFEDDIVARVREFLRATFGEQTLEQNVAFLEDALGKDLRKYFLTEFYKDHLQTYKKHPIYWLFQSPQKQFRALVYLHRYSRDTVNKLLNGYLREFHHKLAARIRDLQHTLESESVAPRDKTRAQKELDKAQKAHADVELYEREILLPLAQRRLEIDLDDGVKANYPKFGVALAPIAGMTDEED